jgi:hypothetical protein
MKNILIKIGLIGIILCLFGIPFTTAQQIPTAAFSRSDEENDLCMIDKTSDKTEITCNLTRDYLDIAKIIRFYPDEGNVTLMMIFNGKIDESTQNPAVIYTMWFNTSYGKTILEYSNGVNNGYTYLFNDSIHVPSVSEPIVDENSIQVTYPFQPDDFPDEGIEARSIEKDGKIIWKDKLPSVRKEIGDDATPIDFENPNKPKDDDAVGNDSPGFSFLILISGVIILYLYYVRKKKY